MNLNDLAGVKDDMVAFIAGTGLRRMPAYVPEDVPSVLFEGDDADSWKDFVEHAKSAGTPFITMSEVTLEPEDIATLMEQLRAGEFPAGDDNSLEDAQELLQHTGKIGYLQLGFTYGGVVYLYETATEWYDQFQHLLETAGELPINFGSEDL